MRDFVWSFDITGRIEAYQSGTPVCVNPSSCRCQVDIQATFNYFGQINPLRIAMGLAERAIACTLSRALGAQAHILPLEVFRQSTILNQADIGNEPVPRLQIQSHVSSHAPCQGLRLACRCCCLFLLAQVSQKASMIV